MLIGCVCFAKWNTHYFVGRSEIYRCSLIYMYLLINRRNCINSQQLHDLVRILRQEMKVSRSSTGHAQAGDLITRNMSKTSVGDNEWIVTPHEDIIRKLATAQEDFQMRSVANDTTFKTSYDAGITKQ